MRLAHPINVLILCTGNSARSIMAEALFNHWGRPRFRAYSAGSFPTGQVNPLALKTLEQHKIALAGARSKSWDEFAKPDAPQMSIIITVCDNAANEVCPVWPGAPVSAHWGVPDPAAVEGDEAAKLKAFRDVFLMLDARIKWLVNLRDDHFEHLRLAEELKRIHREA